MDFGENFYRAFFSVGLGLAGVTHRIAELAEVLAKLPQTYGQFDNRSDDDPPFTRDLSHNSSDESLEREESVQSEAPLMSSPKNNADKITVGDINEDGDTDHCPNSVFFTLKNVSFSTPCKNTELISKLSLNFK